MADQVCLSPRPSLVSRATSTLSLTWDGMAVRINLPGTYLPPYYTFQIPGAEEMWLTCCQRLSSTADWEILYLLQLQGRQADRPPHHRRHLFRLEDLLNPLQWTFLSFFAVFELGSLLCGIASSSKTLIVGRAVAGMGSSGLQNGAYTIIAGSVPLARRPGMWYTKYISCQPGSRGDP